MGTNEAQYDGNRSIYGPTFHMTWIILVTQLLFFFFEHESTKCRRNFLRISKILRVE